MGFDAMQGFLRRSCAFRGAWVCTQVVIASLPCSNGSLQDVAYKRDHDRGKTWQGLFVENKQDIGASKDISSESPLGAREVANGGQT